MCISRDSRKVLILLHREWACKIVGHYLRVLERQGERELPKIRALPVVSHPSPVRNAGLGMEQGLGEYLRNPNRIAS